MWAWSIAVTTMGSAEDNKMKIGKKLLTATSGLVLGATSALAAPTAINAPSAGTVLAPPPPSPELPRREVPKLQEHLGLPDGASKVLNFRVARIRVVGATVVDGDRLVRQFNDILNKPITSHELQSALDRVNKLYEAEGYALGRAFVPPQVVQGGTLIIRVVEGYIGDIRIKTESEAARRSIDTFSRRISEERPLTTATLERFLLLMSDIPGVKVGGQLSGMNIYTGAATLDLTVERRPFTLDTTVDNRTNLDSSPFQTYLTASLNNVLGDGEQLSLTTLATPSIADQQYFRLAYSTFVGSSGLRTTFGGSFARSKASHLPPIYDLTSRSSEVDAALRYPFIRSLRHNLNGAVGVYAIEAYDDLNGQRLTQDSVRACYADGTYVGQLSDTVALKSSVRVTQGLGILGGGPDNRPHSRLGAIPWFFKAHASANLAYAVTPKVGLNAGVEGQYSPDSLYSSEELSFGGAHFGRGYDTSEVSGDSGYGTSLQAQYRLDTDILGGWSITPYTFLDHSQVYNKPVDGQGNARLVSTGIGVTVSNRKWLAMGFEVDKPLNRPVASRGNRDPRLYLSLELTL